MAEKRRSKRYPRRLKVRFGVGDLSQNGTLADISVMGCFIVHQKPPPLDTRIHMQVFTEGEKFIQYEGRVRWQKQVPAELRQIEKNGFGVQFLLPEELLPEVLPHLASTSRLTLSFLTAADLKKVFEQEIKAGGLFLRTDKKLARDATVTVELRLEFTRRTFEFSAHVIHVQETGMRGVGVSFEDTAKVQAALLPYIK